MGIFDDEPTYAVFESWRVKQTITNGVRDRTGWWRFVRKSVPTEAQALALAYRTMKKERVCESREIDIYRNKGKTYDEMTSTRLYRVLMNKKGDVFCISFIPDKKKTEEWAKKGRRDIKVSTSIGAPAYLIDAKGKKTRTENPLKKDGQLKETAPVRKSVKEKK